MGTLADQLTIIEAPDAKAELAALHGNQLDLGRDAPAELQLFRHVVADVARLPVLEIVSGLYFVADLTLGYGEVAFDYLAEHPRGTAGVSRRNRP